MEFRGSRVRVLRGQSPASSTRFLVRPGALSATLISVGAVVGGLPLFWTFLVPIAVAAVIACSIALARRGAAPA